MLDILSSLYLDYQSTQPLLFGHFLVQIRLFYSSLCYCWSLVSIRCEPVLTTARDYHRYLIRRFNPLISQQPPIRKYPPSIPNTANLSPLLLPRTLAFSPNTKPAPSPRQAGQSNMNDGKKSRRRRSSSLLYQEPPESLEHMSDQSALPNLNATWVNAKGQHVPFQIYMGN